MSYPPPPRPPWLSHALLIGAWIAATALVGACATGSTGSSGDGCDCSPSEVCEDGECVPRPCGDGPEDGDCPIGQECDAGVCKVGGACTGDDDCPGGRCVEGGCYPVECQAGQTQECTTECGGGQQRCANFVWRACDAPRPTLEVCGDGRDNNCDGATDEGCSGCEDGVERPCRTDCGAGVERCVGGAFRGCTAERPRIEVCGDGIDNDCDDTVDEQCDGCADGETRECETECGVGSERCVEGTWRECDAPAPFDEVCDGRDNDCDQETDEEIARDCSTACGSGTETCTDGAWSGCDAPLECACGGDGGPDRQVCEHCGFHERSCTDGAWGAFGECHVDGGDCQPGDQEAGRCGRCGTDRRICTAECRWGQWQGCKNEGICEAGQEEREDCGTCGGGRTRVCTEGCGWADWSECDRPPESECDEGQVDDRPCEMCGVERRTCTAECRWGEWGGCGEQGVCEPGGEQGRVCGGRCEVQVRLCDDTCSWGEYGDCIGGGQCSPGGADEEGCGDCGRRGRTCSQECLWGDWGACDGEGICSPGGTEEEGCGESDVGACRLGVRIRACGGGCGWNDWGQCRGDVAPGFDVCGDGIDQDCDGADATRPDQFEPNNTCAAAHFLGVDPDGRVISATIDTAADTDDYYYFEGDDGFSIPGFSEHIVLTLEDVPGGSDYDLYLYMGVVACRAGIALDSSTNPGAQDERVDWTERFNQADDADYYVRVKRHSGNSCADAYRLTVTGLR